MSVVSWTAHEPDWLSLGPRLISNGEAGKARVLSLPFFSERMRDGSLTEDMAGELWDQHFGYGDDGVALTCDEGRFRYLWDAVYKLATTQTGVVSSWQTKKPATCTAR